MVLGKLPVPGRPKIRITVGQGSAALAVGAGGFFWTFLFSSILSLLFLPLFGRRPHKELKYCLKGPLNPNQPANDHLDYIESNAWTRINVMRTLKFILDRKALQTIYFTFIRPILE